MSSKRNCINLYDQETNDDNYKWLIKNVQAEVKVEDAFSRPLKFEGQSQFVIKESGVDYNVVTKMNLNETNIGVVSTDLASELTNRAAGDATNAANLTSAQTTLQSNIDAEIVRATAKENSNEVKIDANTANITANYATLDGKIDTEISDRQTAVTAERAWTTGQVSGLQTQITNLLSNVDATALNSLAEIVTAFEAADQTLTGTVGALNTRLTDLEAVVLALTQN